MAIAVQQQGNVGNDYSLNKPTLLANLLITLAVNRYRQGFLVQNQSGAVMQAVLDDGAGNQVTVITLNSSAVGVGDRLSWSDFPFSGRIRLYAAATTAQFAMREA